MGHLAEDIDKISRALENAPNGDYEIRLRSESKEQVMDIAKAMNLYLYHPCDAKPYHWFMYNMPTSNHALKIRITVRGPYL
jgi:hypothetical protein